MHQHRSTILGPAVALAALTLLAGCGNEPAGSRATDTPSASADASATPDTSAGKGDWLIGLTTVGGADGETSTTVYLTLNPSTGAAATRAMPAVKAASAESPSAALLVSTDRSWAIPDTGIPDAQTRSGKLTVYELGGTGSKVLDIRALTGQPKLQAVGWAFDPTTPDTLRVVGADNSVWAVSVGGGRATRQDTLTTGPWVFTNGFNHNTGVPWVESIDSDATMPAGNGPADTGPITRADGTLLPAGSEQLTALPPSPCRLGGGFTDEAGTSWIFCVDKPSVTTYYLPRDTKDWKAYGTPSQAVAPTAADVPLVLPPQS